jgi:TRAP-type C4-dicarboxylate transport system permease small subunit
MTKKKMSWVNRAFEKMTVAVNVAATAWIFGMIMLVVLDVLGRVVLNSPLTGTPEIIKVSVPAITFLQIGYVLMIEAHIRSGVILNRVSRRAAAVLNIVAAVMGITVFALNLYAGWDLTVTAWDIGEYEGEGALRVPTAPVRTIILFGSAIMIVQFIRIIFGYARQLKPSKR